MVVWSLLLLLGLLLPVSVWSATITAAGCAQSQIQAAVDAAAVGDTVRIPSCIITNFTGTVLITKRIILEGTGATTTVLQRAAVATTESTPLFRIQFVTGFEARHLQVNGTQDTHATTYRDVAFELLTCVDCTLHDLQIDAFAIGVQITGDPLVQRLVLYNNSFTGNFCAPTCGGGAGLGYALAVTGNDTYPALSLGTAQNVFVEDNMFTANRHALVTSLGARVVFRHNTIVDNREDAAALDLNGVTTGTHGTRQVEITDNTITNAVTRLAGILVRGGDGVVANNSFSANLTDELRLSHQAGCTGTYPLADQIRELYLWDNVLNESGPAGLTIAPGCSTYLQAGRDYFLTPRPGYVPFTYPHPHRGGIPPDLTSALEMHLAFDEGAPATIAQDSTAQNHDGVLGSGASWGPGKLGASAVVLDGTTEGTVTVSGELTQPAAVTLAAWVWPTAFPTTSGEVFTLGNQVALRVSDSGVTGFYWNGTTWPVLTAPHALSTTDWTHLAYTATAGSQALYLNGALVAAGSSGAAISYVGQGTDTYLGRLGVAGTTQRFQGAIDDARVYTRVLTPTEVAALAALGEADALSVFITTPTTQPSFSTSTALLVTLGGTTSAPTGVTSVAWTCSTCVPTFGEAVCVPDCATAPVAATWYVPSVTLGLGSNLLTVTAQDGVTSTTDSLTLVYTPPPTPGVCTHFASQAGGGNGGSVGSPFQVAQFFALPPTPGMTLCLKNDTYTGGGSMLAPPAGLSGTGSLPLTVQALNPGGVLLDGQHVRNPVVLGSSNQWWVVRGLNARNGLTSVYQFLGSNNLGTQLVGWNATSGQPDATIFTVMGQNSVVEDSAGWGDYARVIFQGSGTTASPGSGFRRCWGEWNSHPGTGTLGGACAQPGVGQAFENVICTIRESSD